MAGPVFSGACQTTFRLVVDSLGSVSSVSGPDTTVGAIGAAGGSSTSVTVMPRLNGIVAGFTTTASSTLTVTVVVVLALSPSACNSAFVMSWPVDLSMSNAAASARAASVSAVASRL